MNIAKFIKSVGIDIPWHVSRFHPNYNLIELPHTPTKTLEKAMNIGLETGLRYVYQGNVPGKGENTYCYNCGKLLIERYGYHVMKNGIRESNCPNCGVTIDGIWANS